ncbi:MULTISPECIES: pilus assembly protein N-terminal domain-containing protein [unclassified Chelatococcus]|uniref:pilus assembly protein N-terminal domain-containing protein n=1 Tax=unclassified Chelatococcus TaxID=2638111 RepID=UPI001BD0DA2D|nr:MULTISPECIES: pilus assembly protein N-terminal domain-containing protein [unclassified Chelatococcus]MBS7696334.1 pilus assembly protein N-terminal domain-containing protein [Chelatococcus sp. YT9]MBX3556944.1 pilus assembly protein N-terminal domain-containing protein [Chelatococcus sp.]
MHKFYRQSACRILRFRLLSGEYTSMLSGLRMPPGSRVKGAMAGFLVALGMAIVPDSRVLHAEPTDTISVRTNQAKIIRLPENAQTVIVGNPSVADVSLQKNNVLVVTGKSFGTTNVIALDARGVVVGESLLRVEASPEGIVVVQHGRQRQSFICAPSCEPTLVIGDDSEAFRALKSQIEDRNALAQGR